MAKLKDSFITILSWMTELELKPVALMIYAIIWGFSQDGDSYFEGTASYLMSWTGVTRKTVMTALSEMTARGLLEKTDRTINGELRPAYRAIRPAEGSSQEAGGCAKITQGVCKNYTGGCVKITHNNIDIYKSLDNKLSNDYVENDNFTADAVTSSATEDGQAQNVMAAVNTAAVEDRDTLTITDHDGRRKDDAADDDVQAVVDAYHATCPSLPRCRSISDKRRKAIKRMLKEYTLGEFMAACERAEASSFLKNGSGTWRGANLDFICQSGKVDEILEGKYDDRKPAETAGSKLTPFERFMSLDIAGA